MPYLDCLTILIALAGLAVSLEALRRSGRANKIADDANKLATEANELARAPSRLAEFQLDQEISRRDRTQVTLDLVKKDSSGNYRFKLTNIGDVSATDATFQLLTQCDSVLGSDYTAKLPTTLRPGQSVEVFAGVVYGTPASLDVVVTWTNPDGNEDRTQQVVTT